MNAHYVPDANHITCIDIEPYSKIAGRGQRSTAIIPIL